jgi:hypothetical protein
MDRLLNVMTLVSIVLVLTVLFSVRRAHIRPEYSVTWLVISILMLILSRMRSALDALRALLGLPDTPLTLFLFVGALFLILAYRFSVIISHLRDDNVALAQRLAILEHRLRGLENHEG